jgi:putative transferase (TIGR04331 family)
MNIALTALEEFWGDSEDIVLAGKWCLYEQNNYQSSKKNVIIHPYPWNNRDDLYSAYLYTNSIYKLFLPLISEILNKYHSEQNSLRYWEIIIGPWLRYFIQTVYDRYVVIKDISDSYENLECLLNNQMEFIPSDFDEYFENSTSSHYYNQLIFSQILKNIRSSIKIKNIAKLKIKNDTKVKRKSISIKNNALFLLFSIINNFGNKNYLIHKTGFDAKEEIKLALSYKSFPRYFQKTYINKKFQTDFSFRRISLDLPRDDEFCRVLSKIIFAHLPLSYLEGYSYNLSKVKKRIKFIPKFIITSNSLVSDEFMKILSAFCTEKDSKLILHQHGGHYGAGKFFTLEDHEVDVSDLFLTWGWSNNFNPKIKPFFTVKKYPAHKVNRNTKKILVIATSSNLYTKYFYSSPLSSQVIDCSDNFIKVLDNLPFNIRKCVKYRIKNEHGWYLAKRLKNFHSYIGIEDTNKDLSNSIKSSSLVISTYNATVFLQSFVNGIPTLLFWDSNLQEIRDDAVKYYDELQRVGILHHDPVLLAKKITEISNDIEGWWRKKEVVEAVELFCNYFIKQSSNIISEHNKVLNQY